MWQAESRMAGDQREHRAGHLAPSQAGSRRPPPAFPRRRCRTSGPADKCGRKSGMSCLRFRPGQPPCLLPELGSLAHSGPFFPAPVLLEASPTGGHRTLGRTCLYLRSAHRTWDKTSGHPSAKKIPTQQPNIDHSQPTNNQPTFPLREASSSSISQIPHRWKVLRRTT